VPLVLVAVTVAPTTAPRLAFPLKVNVLLSPPPPLELLEELEFPEGVLATQPVIDKAIKEYRRELRK
jgi:hypothetical protein